MNEIRKKPLHAIGYDFVKEPFLPQGKDEYHLRNLQNRSGIAYRTLNAFEIEVLVRNRNTADDWNKIQVSDAFNPELVKGCKFFGLVRIGKLESFALEYHNVCLTVGLYNSTIISCDLGDNVVVNNVNYMSHYIVGNEVMLYNIHELHVTNHAKFGNGIIKEGEEEAVRVWLEVSNENAGRKILPFNGMLAGDAYMWSKYRNDKLLLQKFLQFTEQKFDKQRGYYGKIGDRTIVKNTSIVKDVWIGSDAYIKGANKLKNLTLNSSAEAPSQIGEGCELVNGIIGFGCRAFYGVKAVRFMMASYSQLKYGARLINSYLGNNSTISCCEVLNSLIYSAHEQHHNNSFLCAATVLGQSNMAAGATVGSNHNSRAADGEIVAGRGFWPGLCVSLKHNSKFASFTLIAKGDYSAELNIPLPFSLVSNDVTNDRLIIMPAYWFMYNMYALARNAQKYVDRDRRNNPIQHIEYDYLAPDSITEVYNALQLLKKYTASSVLKNNNLKDKELTDAGELLLEDPNNDFKDHVILGAGFENASRPTHIIKPKEAYHIYKRLIVYYGTQQLIRYAQEHNVQSFDDVLKAVSEEARYEQWLNLGGQLMPAEPVNKLLNDIKNGSVNSWEEVHRFYKKTAADYPAQKLQHAVYLLMAVLKINKPALTKERFKLLLTEAIATREWMFENIYKSREKDYTSEFRRMVYDTEEEMTEVIGKLEDNVFIEQQRTSFIREKESIQKLMAALEL